MFTKCPSCGSLNVRRSSLRESETSAGPRLRSPYRCRDCGERFWVISRRASSFLLAGAVAVLAGAFVWKLSGVAEPPRRDAQRAAAAEEGFAEVARQAERDDPAAELKLSRMYARGEGVDLDRRAAQAWLERAAEHGNADAQYELGNALREGAGVVQDYERAAKWLQLAAMNGHGDAQYTLGQMYRFGVGVPADNVKAYIWFNLAAAQDVAGAIAYRDSVLRLLTPAQVLEAQAEARRLSVTAGKKSAMAP